jgi:hypothetical protein
MRRLALWIGALALTMILVGGQSALYYLPLTVTDRLGYFKDEGLAVEISDLQGGSKALQALLGGSADVVTGAFDHTIQMQAKNQPITAVVQLGRFPGFVLAVVASKAASYRGPRDLKGMKIGITAPGSSTHFMAQHMMVQAGLKPNDAAFIGVGAGSTAVAAAKRGEIDALVNVDPAGLRRRLSGGGALSRAHLRASQSQDRAVAGECVRALPEVGGKPSARRDRQGHAARIRARQHGAVRPIDPQQHPDVFAGRPLQPGGRRNCIQGVARIRRQRAPCEDRHRSHLYGFIRQQSEPVSLVFGAKSA